MATGPDESDFPVRFTGSLRPSQTDALATAQKELVAARAPVEWEVLVTVLDRYIRHHLRHAASPTDHDLAERAVARLRLLGVPITETGSQACDSPVGRVMATVHDKEIFL